MQGGTPYGQRTNGQRKGEAEGQMNAKNGDCAENKCCTDDSVEQQRTESSDREIIGSVYAGRKTSV